VYGDAAVCSMPLAGRVRVTDMWGQQMWVRGPRTLVYRPPLMDWVYIE